MNESRANHVPIDNKVRKFGKIKNGPMNYQDSTKSI